MREVIYDDLECLSEIYAIEEMHFGLVRECVKRDHMVDLPYTDEDIVVESFIDILKTMHTIVSEIKKRVKDFFTKILMLMKNYTSNINRFYNKNKTKLESLSGVSFDISGFTFTLDILPKLKPLYDIIDEYNNELADVASMKVEEILRRQNEYLDAGHLNMIRGDVLGLNRPIRESDFIKTIREFYRNGRDDEQYIHVDDSSFSTAIAEIPTLNKDMKEVTRNRDELLASLDKVESFFKDKLPVVYSGGYKYIKTNKLTHDSGTRADIVADTEVFNEEDRGKIEAYTRFKYNQIHEIATITSLVFMERANAYKDKLKMLEEMISKAIITGNLEGGEQ